MTILFCDMVDYAGMTERLGDQASREVLQRAPPHRARRHRRATAAARSSVQGDGFMVAFGGVARALRCAVDIQRAFDRLRPDETAADRIAVHIGIHTGDALGGGRRLHRAHRDRRQPPGRRGRRPGEILVSSLSEQLVQGSDEFAFDGHRETRLKGMERAQPSATLTWVS